jgi:hypothetical protein
VRLRNRTRPQHTPRLGDAPDQSPPTFRRSGLSATPTNRQGRAQKRTSILSVAVTRGQPLAGTALTPTP